MDTFYKQPTEVLDYDADYSDWMPTSDTITSKTVTCESGLTVDSSTFNVSTHVVKAWISGGTDGEIYKVTVTIVTTGGRTKVHEYNVRIRDQ